MSDKKKFLPFLILGGFAIVAVGGGIFIKAVSTPKTTGFGEKVAQMTEGEEGEEQVPEELARSRRAQQGGQFSDVNYGQSTLGMVKGFFANLFGEKKKGKTDAETASQEQGQPQTVPDPAELMKKMGGQGKMGQGLGEAGGKFGSAGPQTMAGATGESGPNAFGEKVIQTAEGDKLQSGQARTQVGGGKKAATSKKFLSGLGRALGFGDSKGAVGKSGPGGSTDLTQYAKAQYKFESSAVKPGSPQTGIFVDPNKAMGVGEEDTGDTSSQSPGGPEKQVESGGSNIDDTNGIRAKDHDDRCALTVQVQGPKSKDCGKLDDRTVYEGDDGWGSNDCEWSKKGDQVDVWWDKNSSGAHRRYLLTYEDDSWFTGSNDGVKFWKIEYNDACSGEPAMVQLKGEKGFKELVQDQLYMYNKCMYDGCKFKTIWDSSAVKEDCYEKWPQVVKGDDLGYCPVGSGNYPPCDLYPNAIPKAYVGGVAKKGESVVMKASDPKVFQRIDSCESICHVVEGIRKCP